MKTVTSTTTFRDAVGWRLSTTYSEIGDETGRIISDNKRVDRVVTDADTRALCQALQDYAQILIDQE